VTASSLAQLRALFVLRWQMIRSTGVRATLVLVLAMVVWLMILVAGGASVIEPAAVRTAVELAPQTFLGFAILAILAPLTAGGGTEIFPPDQVVAYPIRPRTQYLGALLLAPLNLVWVLQILGIIAETAFLTHGGRVLAGALTSVAYVVAITALGQSLAWLIVGVRQTQRGRRSIGFAGGGLLLGAVLTVKTGVGGALLDHSPTRVIVHGISAGARGDLVRWGVTTGLLVVVAALSLALGERTCGWALRRPGDAGSQRATRVVQRRLEHTSALRTLIAMDRASVWRAPALRRGGLVLLFLPSMAAFVAKVPWSSLAVLPGLVAAGAGLLFGINAFCLDSSGAVFLASLPHDPRLIARSKLLVLIETVFGAVVVTALAGSLRSPGHPTTTELVSIVFSALACTATVVASGLASSVRRPHRADLAGPRDAVAPPGALVLASLRLTVPTGIVALLMEGAAGVQTWWFPLLVAVPVLLVCSDSVRRSLRLYADPQVRSRIVQTVSAG
jgi:hypothetical protein